MQPVVSAAKAWFCTVLSAFGVVILTFIGYLFQTNHESMMGSINDPENGAAVARTVYTAAAVYAAFLLFCGCQAYVHTRKQRIVLQ